MGLRLRIFLGMMVVVVCALLATGFVAYQHSIESDEEYNAGRMLRREAALQRSLNYMLEKLGGEIHQDSLAVVFTDRICELADVHSLTFSLYNNRGLLVTTSAGPADSTVALHLSPEVIQSASDGDGRTEMTSVRGGKDVVWPLKSLEGSVLALAHVHYDPREAEEADWRAFLLRLAPLYSLLLVLVGLLAFWLSNSIVRPLRRLSSDMISTPLKRSASRSLEYRWKDEIGALVKSYNTLLKRLEESMNAQAVLEREGAWREMAQQVAHEIKNPLTPMKLGAQHVQRAWDDNAPDFDQRLKRYVQTTVQQIDSLTHIAEGFAMLATDGQSQPKVLNMVNLLEDVVFLHESQGVKLFANDPNFLVFADKTRLTRAFNNLVQNALESRPDHPVQVEVHVKKEGSMLVVEVCDDGLGIEPERIARIFEPRFTTKTHGLGLGLAMVRAIVQGAKGSIDVKSELNKGSTFTVTLPMHEGG